MLGAEVLFVLVGQCIVAVLQYAVYHVVVRSRCVVGAQLDAESAEDS